ncbi:AEC family transporter [Parvularcula marina]|uniref:AEC family transporter n=1 Tax=Parvularcula marina TaxID=2292771 RepID=UPI003512AF10
MPSVGSLLAPLAGATLIGVIAAWLKLFGQTEARVLSRFVFLVAMPVAVFNFVVDAPPPEPAYLGMIAGYLAGLTATVGLGFFWIRRFCGASIQETGAALFAAICGNAIFLGLPIALGVPGWGPPFLILMVFEGTMTFAIATALMTWPDKDHPDQSPVKNAVNAATRAIRNPVVVGMALGFLLMMLGIQLPEMVAAPLDLFSKIASPLGLFVLGLYLVILPREQTALPTKLLIGLLPLKLIIFPAITAGITWVLTSDIALTSAAALFTVVPPAVSSVVLASSYGFYEKQVAAIVAVGTLIGMLTVTGFLVIALGA